MNSRKCALVTGGSRGIGKAICLALARCNYNLTVNFASNHEAAQLVCAGVREIGVNAEAFQANVGSLEEQIKMVEFMRQRFGRIDLLVNNAAVAPKVRADLLETAPESFDYLMDTNLKGPFFLTQKIARWMVEERRETPDIAPMIVNISSISAYTSSVNRADYCLTKAGISMMTRLFADRLSVCGIPVYEIRPGVIRTDMTSIVQEKYDKMFQAGLTPIPRWGEPEDVAKAVAAIAQGYFPYSTGEVINVDGGFHLRRL
jgi:3-oxoacyl-[acyl-carrier protein] reductase